LSGIYLALVTGAFAVILDRWIFTLPAFDLGPWEITFFNSQTVPVDRLHIPGVDPTKPRAELVVLGVLFCLLALAVIALRRSQYGERLLALKDSPAACATLGLNVRGATLGVFVFSAAMAGVGGAVYAGSFTSVSPDQFNFFTSLPLLLFAVVGGISSPGSSVFAGTTLYGIPIVAATFPILENLLLVLPGTLGITLGRNPDGVVRDLQNRLDPLRWHRAGQVIVAALLAALCVAEWGGLINGWVFGVGCVLVVFGTARVATYERAAPEPSWEWAGIERPFTSADEETLDVTLGTPELTRR
jgi:branched-chain amino acid transport system permease protein